MRIGRLEIRWIHEPYPWAGTIDLFYKTEGEDLSAALTVPETDLFWRAVHQVINEVESETIDGARRYVGNTNQCISAIGAGEGAALVRQRLIEKRNNAIEEAKKLRRTA